MRICLVEHKNLVFAVIDRLVSIPPAKWLSRRGNQRGFIILRSHLLSDDGFQDLAEFCIAEFKIMLDRSESSLKGFRSGHSVEADRLAKSLKSRKAS